MDTLTGILIVLLLGGFFVFGLVGYVRGKSVRSCCRRERATDRA